MNQQPLISIGMPVYNGENYLAEAVESLLGQTFSDFELIISDNGSTDGTEAICRKFQQRDARVRYYRESHNHGAVWNYNRLLDLARGEYFKWSSHDDVHAPTFLEKCLGVLQSRMDVAWCLCRIALIDEDGQPVASNINAFGGTGDQTPRVEHSLDAQSSPLTKYSRSSEKPHQRFDGVILSSSWGVDCYALMRTATLRKTRGFLATYGSEKTLLAELAMHGKYAEAPETLFFVRIHPQASGRHKSVKEQQAHVGPRRGSRWIHPRLQMLFDYVTAIWRAPIGLGDKMRCHWTIVKYMFQVQKWRRVLRSIVRGTGTGAGNELFLTEDSERAQTGSNAPQDSTDSKEREKCAS
jgi:hypothetical protein